MAAHRRDDEPILFEPLHCSMGGGSAYVEPLGCFTATEGYFAVVFISVIATHHQLQDADCERWQCTKSVTVK
jgi:hypothetical protein